MKFIKSSRLLDEKIRNSIATQWKIIRIMLFSLPIKERQQVITEYEEKGDYTILSLKLLIQKHEKYFSTTVIAKVVELEDSYRKKNGYPVLQSPWPLIVPSKVEFILVGEDEAL